MKPKQPPAKAAQDASPWASQDTKTKARQNAKAKTKAAQDAKVKAAEKKAKAQAKATAEARARATNVNHATKDELKKLPGITDAFAAAIIAKRPYKIKADLVIKNAIPKDLYLSSGSR